MTVEFTLQQKLGVHGNNVNFQVYMSIFQGDDLPEPKSMLMVRLFFFDSITFVFAVYFSVLLFCCWL